MCPILQFDSYKASLAANFKLVAIDGSVTCRRNVRYLTPVGCLQTGHRGKIPAPTLQPCLQRRHPKDRATPSRHSSTLNAAKQDEKLYSDMDALLGLELKHRKTIVDAQELPSVLPPSSPFAMPKPTEARGFEQISLWKGDITTLKATAIVNAANSRLLGCFQSSHKCIDNVIHSMAGPRLRAACHEIMSCQAQEEPVGNAQITPGFALPASYVIHTVGPQLRNGSEPTAVEREQLQSCYTNSLDMLLEKAVQSEEHVSIAFPCISTGLFAFPSDKAVPLAVDSVLEWLAAHQEETRSWRVIFNTFLKRDYDLYKDYIESKCPDSVALPPAPVSTALQSALRAIQDADYLLVAGGAGISAAAGLDYTSEAVMKKFHPGIRKLSRASE